MSAYQPIFSSYQPHNGLFADRELAQRVASFLGLHAAWTSRRVRIEASAGRVTIRGRANSAAERLNLESCIRRVAGVRQVISRLQLPTLSNVGTSAAAARQVVAEQTRPRFHIGPHRMPVLSTSTVR